MALFLGCSLLIQAAASANWQSCSWPADVSLVLDNKEGRKCLLSWRRGTEPSAEETLSRVKPCPKVDHMQSDLHTVAAGPTSP